ncbi:MAG: c-type cytochrome [bacterium]|nr:c-type cytochrome [bacterium]
MRLSRIAFLFCSIVGLTGLLIQPAMAAEHAKKMTPAALVSYKITDGPAIKAINKSLTGKAGDMVAGEKTMVNKKKGNCLACHVVTKLKARAAKKPKKYADMGLIGPPLDGAAGRYTEGELRMMLVNAKAAFPDTIMPGFYRADKLTRVMGKFKGKTVINAQDVENILAFLVTLK